LLFLKLEVPDRLPHHEGTKAQREPADLITLTRWLSSPVVDQFILEFALSHTFTPGNFTINKLGGCRLNPQLAKVVARQLAQMNPDGIVDQFLSTSQA
jgi:hypothetical protein